MTNWKWWVEEHWSDSLPDWYEALAEALPQMTGSRSSTLPVIVEWPLWKQMGWPDPATKENQ